jgi:nitrogen-specific signal transduction histidine kinase
MQSLKNMRLKKHPTLEPPALAGKRHEVPPEEPAGDISREVAHELNNVLTIICGYTERLLMKHADNPALRPDLQLICNNARRAGNVVRRATRSQHSQSVTA